MKKDSGVDLNSLKVDGGMVANELLMQFQADLLDVPVTRPSITETTAIGVAYAAGLAVGFWASMDELKQYWSEDKTWQPLVLCTLMCLNGVFYHYINPGAAKWLLGYFFRLDPDGSCGRSHRHQRQPRAVSSCCLSS